MTVARPIWLEAITDYHADEFRTLLDAMFAAPGVVRGGLAVAPTGPVSMAVQVATGFAVVPAKSAANGKYLVEVTATETVPIAAASAYNRVDIIVAQVLDTAFSDASDTAQIVAIQGTSSGLPEATPSNAVLLAQVAVNTGAATIVAGNITDKRMPPPTPGHLYGKSEGAGTVTLATLAADYNPPACSVTVTLPVARTVRIVTRALFQSGTAVGLYRTISSYNTGATVNLASVAYATLNGGYSSTTAVGGNGRQSADDDGTVALAAGTYTFYPVVRRHAAGSATDTANIGYVAVYDAGSA